MNIDIELTDDIATCRMLRRVVFTDEQGVSEADEIDDLDGECLHLLAWDGSVPVGTARIRLLDNVAKIGRVCVISSYRGTGLGAALIRKTLDIARKNEGITQAKLGAQTHALGFYAALGFTPIGPIYEDAGIDHRDMVCDL